MAYFSPKVVPYGGRAKDNGLCRGRGRLQCGQISDAIESQNDVEHRSVDVSGRFILDAALEGEVGNLAAVARFRGDMWSGERRRCYARVQH